MTAEPVAPPSEREQELLGHTLVVIGGSAGIGLERRGARKPREPMSS